MIYRNLSLFLFLSIIAISPLRGESAFEAPPELPGSDVVPDGVLRQSDCRVVEPVPTDGFLAEFQLETAFGNFNVRGVEMLHTRIHELHALEEIAELSRTQLFTDAAISAVKKPVGAAVRIVKDPVGSVKSVPQGVGRLFGSVVKGVGDVGKTVSKKGGEIIRGESGDDEAENGPAVRQDPFGYNKARNQWAAKFNVDPYTSNEELSRKLSDLAKMSFSTSTIAGLGLSQIAAPLSLIGTVDTLVLTKSPAEVREVNSGRLAKLGVPRSAREALLANRWFTPTLPTRFVNALAALRSAENLASPVLLAGHLRSEDEVRFLCRGLELLGKYQKEVGPLRELRVFGRLPGAVAADGTLVVSAPVDVIAWTEHWRSSPRVLRREISIRWSSRRPS